MKMFSVRNIIFWFSLVSGVLFSAELEDFAKDWVGYESLSSPSLNYQGRQIFLDVRNNADGTESLVYASNSEFIYIQDKLISKIHPKKDGFCQIALLLYTFLKKINFPQTLSRVYCYIKTNRDVYVYN